MVLGEDGDNRGRGIIKGVQNSKEINDYFDKTKTNNKPSALIARTIKGKGFSFCYFGLLHAVIPIDNIDPFRLTRAKL